MDGSKKKSGPEVSIHGASTTIPWNASASQNLLMCTQAQVQTRNELPVSAHVFLDTGSQRNLVTSEFIRRIGSTPVRHDFVRIRGFDTRSEPRYAPVHELIVYTIYDSSYQMEFLETISSCTGA
jgi:hypothetical protein